MSLKPRPPLPPGPFLVVGLARSGVAAALALRERGEEVIGCDAAAPDVSALRERRVEVHVADDGAGLLERARTVVKSPGVPQQAPAVQRARARGLTVIGELELAWRLIANDWVAVTGTNGKTTTVELLGHLHREAGLAVAVAGNVGTAAASLVGSVAPGATVVCEASSFQLEDTEAFAPEAAALLNVSEDHLDRHGTIDAYLAAKLQVFARQGDDDVAVAPCELGAGDLGATAATAGQARRSISLGGAARRICFGESPEAQLADRAGQLWWADEPLIGVEEIRLRGLHNRANAMAAAALALARGMPREAVAEGLRTFSGVAHRLEEVGRRNDVLYVNDSKATNVASSLVALRSFEVGVHAILGGRGKGGGYGALRDEVRARCAGVYLIGEEAAAIGADLAGLGVPLWVCGDLEHAVDAARAQALPGAVVLLSPACTSFDQYRDFEERGDHFRALARAD
ncbi:MAG: UDP-N-acetylmuramoyl-L-alanine--D-glutamate ligase [Solirubrobacteraceae bacterium]